MPEELMPPELEAGNRAGMAGGPDDVA